VSEPSYRTPDEIAAIVGPDALPPDVPPVTELTSPIATTRESGAQRKNRMRVAGPPPLAKDAPVKRGRRP
jgi:hypothetical protein